jgi:zinc/manganese transport system permease protein
MLSHAFMRYALIAGVPTGACCGLVGYLLVMRRQVFTGDALSHAAFTGSLAALAAGADLRFGLFASTIAVAVAMGLLGHAGRADDVVIGSVFVWVLGLGVLFLSIYTRSSSGANGTAGVSVLFGSIFGLTPATALWSGAICVAVIGVVVVLARPLLFATIDEKVASASGVSVTALGLGFLALVGVVAAEATQAVGALLLLGLLAAPGAAAHRLTARPFRGLAIGSAIGAAAVAAGLAIAYAFPTVPPSFAVMAVSAGAFAAASLARGWPGSRETGRC